MNLKKNGKVFTSKFVGTGPSSYEKKNFLGRGLTKVEKRCCKELNFSLQQDSSCCLQYSGTAITIVQLQRQDGDQLGFML